MRGRCDLLESPGLVLGVALGRHRLQRLVQLGDGVMGHSLNFAPPAQYVYNGYAKIGNDGFPFSYVKNRESPTYNC